MSRGKKHNFLVMEIELVKDGKIKIGMKSYINEAIKTFGEYVLIRVTSLAQVGYSMCLKRQIICRKKKPQLFTQHWQNCCG